MEDQVQYLKEFLKRDATGVIRAFSDFSEAIEELRKCSDEIRRQFATLANKAAANNDSGTKAIFEAALEFQNRIINTWIPQNVMNTPKALKEPLRALSKKNVDDIKRFDQLDASKVGQEITSDAASEMKYITANTSYHLVSLWMATLCDNQNCAVRAPQKPARVGLLDSLTQNSGPKVEEDYSLEPKRDPKLHVASARPFNAEPPRHILVASHTTPNELFFVRHHHPVPKVDAPKFKLWVGGKGFPRSLPSLNLSLQDIQTKFPKHVVCATIQCAGNRRMNLDAYQHVRGLLWDSGAISTAQWGGALLRDVVKWIGNQGGSEVQHIQFEGLDGYGASIPFTSYEQSDVLLAYEMNGEELPPDHGYPLRVIVPGVVGARHVKWVSKIIFSGEESQNYHQQKYYKGLPPNVNTDNLEEYLKKVPGIQEMPVTSAVLEPNDGASVSANEKIVVKGYAYSGGGRGIIRVDVSLDGGKNWLNADLADDTSQKDLITEKRWSWTLWSVTASVPTMTDTLNICSKAVDTSYNTQPDDIASVWNVRGVLNNARHHVKVLVNGNS